ncbi:MAG TPA: hypothetical protein GX532_03100 [Clostridia bacterium]|jgi:hypothetical protein|nr:hypothetical protein [Clostridia bacterium]HHY05952.1 hypothetical protein [Clostridia bacterium]
MGLVGRFGKTAPGFLSPINEKNIYEWVMGEQSSSDYDLEPIVKKAKVEYNLYLAEMSPEEKRRWEIAHQQGRKMACKALNDYRNSEIKKDVNYFSLNNSPEVNQEIFAKDSQHQANIFNKIREYFYGQLYDRERVLAIGCMERETNILNRYWRNAREYVLAENQKMKEILKMNPVELVKLNASEFNEINFNGADVIRFRTLNEKYFNDPLVNSYVERVEEIVFETEQLRKQIECNWKEERSRRGLSSVMDSVKNEFSGFSDLVTGNDTIKGRNSGKLKDYER